MKDCFMQHFSHTCRRLQARFTEQYDRRMIKPRQVDQILYRHLKKTHHSPRLISLQPVEQILYDNISTKRGSFF